MVKIQQSEPETLREYMVDFDYIAPKSSSNKVVTEKYLFYLFILFDRKGQLLGHETGLAMPDPKFSTY